MVGIIRSISAIFLLIFLIGIPAIPGAVLWWFLKPVMFWEKFAWVITSMVVYIIITLFIASFILNQLRDEEDEETADEDDE
jgi:MFS-type transporter involved in bile tolerance (Atg22 family)